MRRAIPPVLIVGVSLVLAWLMVLSHESPNVAASADLRTWAEVVVAEPQSLRLSVTAQGTVEPRMETDLVAEVGGRIVEVATALQAGGFFESGEVLARVDGRDYENALARAKAALDRARSELAVRGKSKKRMDSLGGQGLASESNVDDAVNAERIARANLAEAVAVHAKAELDLERTTVRAPFDGRVRNRHIGAGQFVMPGARLARIYATDLAEIRLPLSVDDLAFLDLPLAYSAASSSIAAPAVQLRADMGVRVGRWSGEIVRTEGVLDPLTRNVVAVAQVEDPFGRRSGDGHGSSGTAETSPLAPGLFVDAEISGRHVDRVFALPAAAYRPGAGLLLVDEEDRLEIRAVEVLRRDARQVFVTEGIEAGERVVISAIESPIAGMKMRVTEAGLGPESKVGGRKSKAGGARDDRAALRIGQRATRVVHVRPSTFDFRPDVQFASTKRYEDSPGLRRSRAFAQRTGQGS